MQNANAIVTVNVAFVPAVADKDSMSAIRRFCVWLDVNRVHWFNADLGAYRDHLLLESNLTKASAKKHMERIRKRYRDLLNDNSLRDMLYTACPHSTPADKFAFVSEAIIRLTNNTQYGERTAVKVASKMHHADSEFVRLSPDEIDAILDAVPRVSLLGYRDAALIALAYACGLREAEVVAVTIDDMLQAFGGKPALRVAHGKGDKQRMVIYGEMAGYLAFVQDWLDLAEITSGPVFRSIAPEGNTITHGTLTARAFAKRLPEYAPANVTPHTLRRSYARNLYEAGCTVEYIRQQLGHNKIETTLLYIGALSE